MFTFKVMRPTPGRFDEDWTVFEAPAYAVEDNEDGTQRVVSVMSAPPYTAAISNPEEVADVLHSIVVSGPIYVMNAAGKTIDTIRPLLPSVVAKPQS